MLKKIQILNLIFFSRGRFDADEPGGGDPHAVERRNWSSQSGKYDFLFFKKLWLSSYKTFSFFQTVVDVPDVCKEHANDEHEDGPRKKKQKVSASGSPGTTIKEAQPKEEEEEDIVRFPFKHAQFNSAPLSVKLVEGYYFTTCPCSQLFKAIFFQHVGCICRLIMYGVEGQNNLRFFKGARRLPNPTPTGWRTLKK